MPLVGRQEQEEERDGGGAGGLHRQGARQCQSGQRQREPAPVVAIAQQEIEGRQESESRQRLAEEVLGIWPGQSGQAEDEADAHGGRPAHAEPAGAEEYQRTGERGYQAVEQHGRLDVAQRRQHQRGHVEGHRRQRGAPAVFGIQVTVQTVLANAARQVLVPAQLVDGRAAPFGQTLRHRRHGHLIVGMKDAAVADGVDRQQEEQESQCQPPVAHGESLQRNGHIIGGARDDARSGQGQALHGGAIIEAHPQRYGLVFQGDHVDVTNHVARAPLAGGVGVAHRGAVALAHDGAGRIHGMHKDGVVSLEIAHGLPGESQGDGLRDGQVIAEKVDLIPETSRQRLTGTGRGGAHLDYGLPAPNLALAAGASKQVHPDVRCGRGNTSEQVGDGLARRPARGAEAIQRLLQRILVILRQQGAAGIQVVHSHRVVGRKGSLSLPEKGDGIPLQQKASNRQSGVHKVLRGPE